MEKKIEFKLKLCQTQEEWERFNRQCKQGYIPDTQISIITTLGSNYTKNDTEIIKPLDADLFI